MSANKDIELAIEAGMKPYYGCKTRHDLECDDCPCDADGNCTQSELAGFKLPIENLAIITKFAELIRSQGQEAVAKVIYTIGTGLLKGKIIPKVMLDVKYIDLPEHTLLYTSPPNLQEHICTDNGALNDGLAVTTVKGYAMAFNIFEDKIRQEFEKFILATNEYPCNFKMIGVNVYQQGWMNISFDGFKAGYLVGMTANAA